MSNPNDVEGSLLLARCYLSLNDPRHAKETLLVTAKLDVEDPRSHYMLAEVYQVLNQQDDRKRELDLFNKLSAAQKAKGADESGSKPPDSQGPAAAAETHQ